MMLASVLACISLMFFSVFVAHHRHYVQGASQTLGKLPSLKIPLVMGVTCVGLSLVAYSQLGRFHDWDQGTIDQQLDYLMAAEITKARQRVEQSPNNTLALLALADAYTAGGMYAEAVSTLTQVQTLKPEDAEVLGLLATAKYYQDAKLMTEATQALINQALALYPNEKNTRLLLATHAYFQQDYQQAIQHWQQVLINDRQVIDTQAIQWAIINATNKMNSEPHSKE